MANSNQRPAASVPQRQGALRPGVNQRPGTAYKSAWGARILAFVVLATIAGIALYLGLDDDSELPEEAGYIIVGVCVLVYALVFFQQVRQKYVLFADRLEAYGLSGKSWEVPLAQIEGIRYDQTQGNFPLGKAIVIFDKQTRMLSVPRSVADVKGLAARLTEAHTQAVLPDLLMRLEGGDDIRFGDVITVNRDMIIAPDPATQQPTQFGLREFQQAFVNKGELTMNMIGRPAPLKLKVRDVLNAHLLVNVITKAKGLGPRVEVVIPIAHDALERTEAMEKISVTGENKPVRDE